MVGDEAYVRDELQRYRDELRASEFRFRMGWPGLPRRGVLATIRRSARSSRPCKLVPPREDTQSTQPPNRFETVRLTSGMGAWSRLAGEIFLDWLAPREGLRWIDVGCGSGAFTELLALRLAPSDVQGIVRSEAQLAFAVPGPPASATTFSRAYTGFPFDPKVPMPPSWRW